MMTETLVMGAVAYAAKVVTIWDGFKEYFVKHGLKYFNCRKCIGQSSMSIIH